MWDSLIKNLSRHVSLTDEEVQTITSCFRHRKFRKRQYILQQGDISRNETYIISGLTRTYEVDDKGQEHVVQFGPEDWWVGDMYSYLTDTPSQFNIDCLEDTEVLQISKANQEMLYREVPKLERHFRIMIQNAYVSSLKRISSNLSKSAAERYAEFIARYPCIGQRVPNHQIASYLGITPQSLSRVRRKAVGG
jgi:CRP-like cAMP-binding protein